MNALVEAEFGCKGVNSVSFWSVADKKQVGRRVQVDGAQRVEQIVEALYRVHASDPEDERGAVGDSELGARDGLGAVVEGGVDAARYVEQMFGRNAGLLAEMMDDRGGVADLEAAEGVCQVIDYEVPAAVDFDGLDLVYEETSGYAREGADEAHGDVGVKQEGVDQVGIETFDDAAKAEECREVERASCHAGCGGYAIAPEQVGDGSGRGEAEHEGFEFGRVESGRKSVEV